MLSYQQANTNKPVVDTTPTCSYISSGGIQTNVFLYTAATTTQSLKYAAEDLGFGTSLQSYSMIRVTTKVNGKLTFTGSNGGGLFSIAVFSNVDPCAINARTANILTSAYTASSTTSSATLTFNQANTFLVLSTISFNSNSPSISVIYSD
ncbi:MAG TPA: hypothetical protein PKH22_07215 [Leptospiraceae bacterium]|nr:hypothetical protein [Leptospiraceae bacterium]